MAIRRSDYFKTEIALLTDEKFQRFAVWFLEGPCPKWFFSSPASSSGKYHPDFVQGEGGLVRHCKAVAQMAHELARNPIFGHDPEDDFFHDCVVLAGMLHDCCKYGTTDDYKDAWFVGYTPNVVTGVWVGVDNLSKGGTGMTGGTVPAKIWKAVTKVKQIFDTRKKKNSKIFKIIF